MEPFLSQQDVQFPIRLPGIEKNGDRCCGCGETGRVTRNVWPILMQKMVRYDKPSCFSNERMSLLRLGLASLLLLHLNMGQAVS